LSDKKYRSSWLAGKLRVHRYLAEDAKVRKWLPRTSAFNKTNLTRMAQKHGTVYVKPDIGSLGLGIYRVRRASGRYRLRSSGGQTAAFADPDALYRYLRRRGSGRRIVQQGIALEKVNGRTYDIRSMMQRKRGGPWTLTGIFAKVGKPGRIVNNYARGGRIVLLNRLFRDLGLPRSRRRKRLAQLTGASYRIARVLSARKAGMYEMGIDFAYDRGGRLRVLEVNSRHPQFYPLKNISPSMYDRMMRYARSIGRTNP